MATITDQDRELWRLLNIAHDYKHPLDIDEGLIELAENALDPDATEADKQNAIDYLARAIPCHRGGSWHNWLADGTCTDCAETRTPTAHKLVAMAREAGPVVIAEEPTLTMFAGCVPTGIKQD